MTKNLIRLTENDLHRIIKESVNNILTELDWRTYANAAKKSRELGDDRERKFKKGAFDSSHKMAYNDKYGQTYSSANIEFDDDLKAIPDGMNKDSWGNYDYISGFGDEGYEYESDNFPNQKFYGSPSYLNNKNIESHYRDLEKQANDYNNGKSKYIKGKGWQ